MKSLSVLIFCVGLTFSSVSSASFYHYGRYAVQTSPDDKTFLSKISKEPDSGLVISGALDPDRSSTYFGAFDFVIENKSDQWIVLREVRISFLTPEQNQNISIPVGAQFYSWYQAMRNLQTYNQKKAAVIGGVLGATLMVSGENQSQQNFGAITTGLSIAALATAKNYSEILVGLPTDHLLYGDMLVPPGLFLKRGLIVNSTKHKETGYVHTLVLEFKDDSGTPQKYYLQFRERVGTVSGGWQADYKIGDGGIMRVK